MVSRNFAPFSDSNNITFSNMIGNITNPLIYTFDEVFHFLSFSNFILKYKLNEFIMENLKYNVLQFINKDYRHSYNRGYE